jgi:SPX domain protein involved in polyphosphate accumulation
MINNLRLERKWVFNNTDKITLLSSLINSNLYFKEHFEERSVNSIYYDNLSLTSAVDNLAGNTDREKFRVRWYGEDIDLLKKPILERKIKKNFYGYKKYYQLKKFDKKKFNEKNLSILTKNINILIKHKNLYPVSVTSYKRIYLISSNGQIRATLDFDIKYKKLMNYIEDFFLYVNDIVLEIKYPHNLDTYVRNELSGITRVSKNSKYINSLLNSNFY